MSSFSAFIALVAAVQKSSWKGCEEPLKMFITMYLQQLSDWHMRMLVGMISPDSSKSPISVGLNIMYYPTYPKPTATAQPLMIWKMPRI